MTFMASVGQADGAHLDLRNLDTLVDETMQALRALFSQDTAPLRGFLGLADALPAEQGAVAIRREIEVCLRYFQPFHAPGAHAQNFIDAFVLVRVLPSIQKFVVLVDPHGLPRVCEDPRFKQLRDVAERSQQGEGLLIRDSTASLRLIRDALTLGGRLDATLLDTDIFTALTGSGELIAWYQKHMVGFRDTLGLLPYTFAITRCVLSALTIPLC